MQKEFEDIVFENFPIRETVERISRAERNTEIDFDVFSHYHLLPEMYYHRV